MYKGNITKWDYTRVNGGSRSSTGDTSPRITIRKIERVISGHRVKWTTLCKREQRMSPPLCCVVACTHSYGNPLAWTEDRRRVGGTRSVIVPFDTTCSAWLKHKGTLRPLILISKSSSPFQEGRSLNRCSLTLAKLSPVTSSSSPWLLHLPVILNSYFCILLSFACAESDW